MGDKSKKVTPASLEAEEATLHKRQVIGLLLLGAVILLVVLVRAPWHYLFPPGWWRP